MELKTLRRTIQRAAELLAARDFKGLASLSGKVRFSAAELAEAAADYPGRLALPPDDWLDALALSAEDAAAIRSGVVPQFFVDVALWDPDAPEPGPRLTLELLLTEAPGEFYRVEVCDLYVEDEP